MKRPVRLGIFALAFTSISILTRTAPADTAAPRTNAAVLSTSSSMSSPAPGPSPNPTPDPKLPPATVQNEIGKPYLIKFTDGREAALVVSTIDANSFQSSFKITDNTCSDRQNMRCTYNFGLRIFTPAIVWTKNPDASKIGRAVERGYIGSDGQPTGFTPLSPGTAIESGGVHRARAPLMNEGLAPTEIECQDFSWLPGGAATAPEHLHISRWDGEDNTKNPETGFNENRTVGGAYGVELSRVSATKLKIDSANSVSGFGDTFDLLMLQPAVGLTIRQPDGGVCQVGVASNLLAELQSKIVKMLSMGASSMAPFIVGSNEILSHPSVKSEIDRYAADFAKPHSELNQVYR